MKNSKDSVELKVKELQDLVVKEVKQIDGFCTGVQKNVDVFLSATWTLIEEIRAFNLKYKEELSKKNESDGKLFLGIENSLNKFQEEISKISVSFKISIYEETLNNTISLIEESFKVQLDQILDLKLRLPTNASWLVLVSQNRDKGGSLNVWGEQPIVFGKLFTTQLPTSILIKLV